MFIYRSIHVYIEVYRIIWQTLNDYDNIRFTKKLLNKWKL